ncbi:MAG: hypothetical protein K0S38_14 [Candidatus Paceibacter sp.]|nr:hypothetical protein [Candidatus Paceibacter sp.]
MWITFSKRKLTIQLLFLIGWIFNSCESMPRPRIAPATQPVLKEAGEGLYILPADPRPVKTFAGVRFSYVELKDKHGTLLDSIVYRAKQYKSGKAVKFRLLLIEEEMFQDAEFEFLPKDR